MKDIFLVSKNKENKELVDKFVSIIYTNSEMLKFSLAAMFAIENGLTVKLSLNLRDGAPVSSDILGKLK